MLAGFIGCLLGLGLARLAPVSAETFGVAGLVLLLLAWRVRQVLFIAMLCCGICLGIWRGAAYEHGLEAWNDWYDRPVTLRVVASTDAIYGKHSQLSFTAEHVVLPDGRLVRGHLQVGGFGENMVYQGDELVVAGKLRDGYGSYMGTISFAKLQLVAHHDSPVANLRRKFAAGMASALPEPGASFAMGVLIGQRSGLSDEVKQDLLMVGLTHIIAVSGYNLTIILHATRKLLAGQSKRLALLLALALIGIFLLITGSSASIVRAAIVSMLSIMTAYYGRTMPPLNLISLAAVITAWANPLYIWTDASWYLSFLAFFGVMILAPCVNAKLPKRVQDSVLVGVGIESLSAEAMTLPYILHVFGQMSFVGLLGNILVVALIPLAMLLGLFAGLAGMFHICVGYIALPARLLLMYMLDAAHVLAGLPHVFTENISLTTNQMLVAYLIVSVMSVVLWRQTKQRRYAKITDNDTTNFLPTRSSQT